MQAGGDQVPGRLIVIRHRAAVGSVGGLEAQGAGGVDNGAGAAGEVCGEAKKGGVVYR